MTSNTAQQLARKEANAAVVKVLTPFCIASFQKATDAADQLAALKKTTSPWGRETFIKEGKWATIGTEQNNGVVDACAAELYKL